MFIIELVRAIAGSVPVVLISAVSGPAIDRAAERLGVLAVLPKPFQNADLLHALERGLKGGSASRSGP